MGRHGLVALARALGQWRAGVVDPEPGGAEAVYAVVTAYLRDGFGWGPATQYRGDDTYAWCGAFAAWCQTPELRLEHRRAHASTYRLHVWGRKDPRRCVAFSAVLPGDVVCVGGGDYGSHVTLALGWGDERYSTLVTVSGNGEGRLPDGGWGEGVVLNVYPRSAIRAAYRPLPGDLEI